MINFDFYFGVYLGEMVLRHTDNLSKTLQKKELSAAEGQQVSNLHCNPSVLLNTLICFGKH